MDGYLILTEEENGNILLVTGNTKRHTQRRYAPNFLTQITKGRSVKKMDKLMEIALLILIPIVVLLAICGTSVVVCLCLNLFFGINVFGLT